MKEGVLWPEELLGAELKAARIIGFGYDSGIVHSDSAEVTQGSLEGDAPAMCAKLVALREETNTVGMPA